MTTANQEIATMEALTAKVTELLDEYREAGYPMSLVAGAVTLMAKRLVLGDSAPEPNRFELEALEALEAWEATELD